MFLEYKFFVRYVIKNFFSLSVAFNSLNSIFCILKFFLKNISFFSFMNHDLGVISKKSFA